METKLKVLIYSDCYLFGGSERLILNIIRNPIIQDNVQIVFGYRNHKIYRDNLLKEFSKEEQKKFLFPLSILTNDSLFYKIYLKKIPLFLKKSTTLPFIFFSKTGIYFLFNFISQVVALKRINPNVVHINNGGYPAAHSCNTMIFASKFCGIKNVFYQVNNLAETQKGFFDKIFDKLVNRDVDIFITASSEAKIRLSSVRKFNIEKIRKIPNTICEEKVTLSRRKIVEELKFKNSDFILCNVALLSVRKGQRFLLEALSIIKKNHPTIYNEIRLLIIGNGEEEHKLKDYALFLDISAQVSFLGFRNDSINFIDSCDVFILPSISDEDMPLTILSAMSRGKTIVATDFGGIKEEIENGESGILLSRDPITLASDLSETIISLYNNRSHNYGINAKKRFNNLFSSLNYGKALYEVYIM